MWIVALLGVLITVCSMMWKNKQKRLPVFILHSSLVETTLLPQQQFMGLIYILTPLHVNLQKSHIQSYKVFEALPERKMTTRTY